ncbi:MAG: thioredoxin domain-containing protein [Alphaproteobacteria bacterium]|nr:thioredoxin domain-containing protein [Alphaproteobacteria bacterium]MDD9920615.1 thioredoxin domain-containing protein [Alphaproteobacteria bacterium]
MPLHHKENKESKSTASLLLLGGIGLFLLIGLQIAYLILNQTNPSQPANTHKKQAEHQKSVTIEKPKITASGFSNIALKHPKRKQYIQRIPGKPITVKIKPLAHNFTTGSKNDNIVLTIFGDPSCGPCRQQIASVVKNLPPKTKVVYKYYPQADQNPEGGIFQQLAAKKGLWNTIHKKLENAEHHLDFNSWTSLLEREGLNLREQRELLRKHTQQIVGNLQADINQADINGIKHFPAFIINNYLIDGKILTLGNMSHYVKRLKNNERIVNKHDY